MGRRIGFACAAVLASGLVLASGVAVLRPGVATAQIPTPPPGPAEINACLCLQRSYTVLAADVNAKNGAYQATNQQLADLNAQLARERSSANVDNPDAVERVKALLERRDAVSNSLQPAYSAAADATSRYNAAVSEYNAHCANRPFIPVLTPEVQAGLVCPPGQ
jgi:hypothetical protein